MPSFQNVGGAAYKPGLQRIMSFCERLSNPHKAAPVLHIAGTNGKGSTSHILASVLSAAGYKVGLFTSPHLQDFRERIRVGGEMISEEEVVEFVAKWRDEMEKLQLSFFEMTAAMAFDHFARCEVDVMVIETGLGGRLDATNVVTPALCVITNIAIEHTQYLGSTKPEIAAEKGGIIKRSAPTIIGERDEETDPIFTKRGEEVGTRVIFAQDLYRVEAIEEMALHQRITLRDIEDESSVSYDLDLKGDYQQKNIVTALAAIDTLNNDNFIPLQISQLAIERGIASVTESTSLSGRWQQLGTQPTIICDTGHNDHGIREVAKQLSRQSYERLYCVVGFARDKDLRKIIAHFPAESNFIFTRAKVERAFRVEEIAEVAEEMGVKYECVESVRDAIQRARERAAAGDMIFIGGSNFVVAEIELS